MVGSSFSSKGRFKVLIIIGTLVAFISWKFWCLVFVCGALAMAAAYIMFCHDNLRVVFFFYQALLFSGLNMVHQLYSATFIL